MTPTTKTLYDLVLDDCAAEYATAPAQRKAGIVKRFAHEWLMNHGEAERRLIAHTTPTTEDRP